MINLKFHEILLLQMYSMKLVHQNLIKDLKGDIMRLINNKIFARRSIFPPLSNYGMTGCRRQDIVPARP